MTTIHCSNEYCIPKCDAKKNILIGTVSTSHEITQILDLNMFVSAKEPNRLRVQLSSTMKPPNLHSVY